jgi:hypothetical protein
MTIPLFARRSTTRRVSLESRKGTKELAKDEGLQIRISPLEDRIPQPDKAFQGDSVFQF